MKTELAVFQLLAIDPGILEYSMSHQEYAWIGTVIKKNKTTKNNGLVDRQALAKVGYLTELNFEKQ